MTANEPTAGRGLLIVVDDHTAQELLALEGDPQAALDFARREADDYMTQGALEPVYELDTAWRAIHRCLSGSSPLDMAVLGGRSLGDDSCHLFYKTPEEVRAVAAALEWFTEDDLRGRYAELNRATLAPEQDDWEYLWYFFAGLVDFYHFAAEQGLGVVFSTAGAPESWAKSLLQLGVGASGGLTVSLDEDANLPPRRWWLNLEAPPLVATFRVAGPGAPRSILNFVNAARAGDSPVEEGCLELGTLGGVPARLVWDGDPAGSRFFLVVQGEDEAGRLELTLTGDLLEDFLEAHRQLVDDVGMCEDLEAILCDEP